MATATTTRKIIKVTNNSDDGDGSLREAIRQGNEAVKAGQSVEIAFTSNFHIKVKTGYHLEKGDWTFNQKLTKDIIIDGVDASGPLFQIGNQDNINDSVNTSDIEELNVDVTRIHLINSHVEGGDGEKGGGGGLGAGSALLHFNGKVTWRDSSFQGNTVEGGTGAEGARGGNSFYATGANAFVDPTSGESGERGGGFNDSAIGSKSGKGGRKGWSDYMHPFYMKGWIKRGDFAQSNVGENGSNGSHGSKFGEGGGGGGGGGGGAYQSRPKTDDDPSPIIYGYSKSNGSDWGNGGYGGRGGNGNFGAGGGVGGSAGANAGADRYWSHDFWPIGSWKAATPNWTYQNKQGANGRSGEWASAPTKASDPTRTAGGNPGRGGDGAALGVVSSFARENEKSSLNFENVDFRKNNAIGGDNTGRFANVFSQNLTVFHDNLTNSTGDSYRGAVDVYNGEFNTESAKTDKSKIHNNSGRFKEVQLSESVAPQEIFSASYEVDSSIVQTFGKVHQLGNSGGHTITLHAYHKDSDVKQPKIEGAEDLLQSVRDINNLANKTKSEDEIRETHKGLLGSITSGVGFKTAGKEVAGKLEKELDDYIKDHQIEKKLNKVKKYGKYTLGAAALIGETIFNQMAEDARIEKELEEKRQIDEGRVAINRLIPKELTVTPFDVASKRTYDSFKGFEIGRDQILFSPLLKPRITYNDHPNGGTIDIKSLRTDNVDDNAARLIGQIQLTEEQSANARKHGNDTAYFQNFIHIMEEDAEKGDAGYYVLSRDSQWQYISRLEDRKVGGIGNDRIIISRNEDVDVNTVLMANGFEGHDRITGDIGNSLLKGESGNDFFDPGRGSDTVKGGSGADTVSYMSLRSAVTVNALTDKNEITVTESAGSWTDKLSDVEVIRTWGGSDHTLVNAKKSSLQGHGYRVQTGATGTTEGSQYDDNLFISYAGEYNTEPAKTTLQGVTIVDGKKGNDALSIDGLAAHVEAGQKFELTYSDSSKSAGFITNITNDSNDKILEFAGIDRGVTFTDVEWNSQGFATVTANADNQTEQISANLADIDFDPLIGSASNPQYDYGVQDEELDGLLSADFRDGNITAHWQTGALPQSAKVDPLPLIGEISTALIEDELHVSLPSTVSMSHKAWSPETEQQAIWGQKEFVTDPLA